jgi:hypothetical protein
MLFVEWPVQRLVTARPGGNAKMATKKRKKAAKKAGKKKAKKAAKKRKRK